MKIEPRTFSILPRVAWLFSAGLMASAAHAQPLITSWLTTYTGKYARIYTSDANKNAGSAVTTWSNGTQSQSLPAYCGVQEVSCSTDWVYVRSSGLGSHTMGPWYLNAGHTQVFPNYPKNQNALFRFPRTNSVPVTKTLTGLGTIGFFVDGVAMFDSRDGFVWTGSGESGMGTGYWNREAYVNEGVTFDPGYAHQENSGTHHYHANPIALRYLLGDHVDYNAGTKTYSESVAPATNHSPILGWVRDGYPVYGPYGYSNATDSASGVRRMVSGYVVRNGQSGTQNLASVGRNTIAQWAARLYNVSSNQAGPSDFATYPLGRYMEDNEYLGDLGFTQGVDFDLDEYNGRFCVTPEFPAGTYAYFVAINSSGTPVFPYNIGRAYRGNPTGGTVTSVAEAVTTNFTGGANSPLKANLPAVTNNTVTLTWSAVEGGSYLVETTTTLTNWSTLASNVVPQLTLGAFTNVTTESAQFYRYTRTAIADYDGNAGGGGSNSTSPGGSAARGTTVTVLITISAPPMLPVWNGANAGPQPVSVTLAGTIPGTAVSRPSQSTVQATFAIPAEAPTGLQNIVVAFNVPSYITTFTINP